MKYTSSILLLFIFIITGSFKCNECLTRHTTLDGSHSWLPVRGISCLVFTNESANTQVFSLRSADTTFYYDNDCGGIYSQEKIEATLYLNSSRTDSLHFNLSGKAFLCVFAGSNGVASMAMCDVFRQADRGFNARRLSDYSVGGRTYRDVI